MYCCHRVSTELHLTNISYHILSTVIPHPEIFRIIYSLCSLLYSSQQFHYLLRFSTKILVILIVSAVLQKWAEIRFKCLPEVTALSNCFSDRRPYQHHSASGDCTNRKRRRMQHGLCWLRRYHPSYDLCCSSWWRQRFMSGNSVMIRVNIYMWTFRIWYKHTTGFYNHCEDYLKYFRSSVEVKSTTLSAVPTQISISNRHVYLQCLTVFILISPWSSNGCFRNYDFRNLPNNYFGLVHLISRQ